MKIKKGDKVLIINGKDQGKVSEVLLVNKEQKRVFVQGINMAKKHLKPRKESPKGQRIEIEKSVDVSNVKLICPKCTKAARVGYKYITKNNKEIKVRICKKCQQEI